MKKIRFSALALSMLFISTQYSFAQLHGESRIFNGEEAKAGEFPFYVAINRTGDYYNHQCGAVLINKEWVLTAAHCVNTSDANKYPLFIGLEKYWPEKVYKKKAAIGEIFIHPQYDGRGQNDIALIKLASVVKSEHFAKLDGIDEDIDKKAGARITPIGFGKTESAPVSPALLKTRSEILPDNYCTEVPEGYPPTNYNSENNLCTGNRQGNSHATGSGDSGGPHMILDYNNQYVVVGLTARALFSPATQTTKVAHFADWIKKTIKENGIQQGAPQAVISGESSEVTSTDWLMLAGNLSSSPEGISPRHFKYHWQVIDGEEKLHSYNQNKVTTQLRLLDKPKTNFTIKVKLTVTDPKGRESSEIKEINASLAR